MPEEHVTVTIELVAELGVQLTSPLDPSDVQALHKTLPGYGYQAMVDDTANIFVTSKVHTVPIQ